MIGYVLTSLFIKVLFHFIASMQNSYRLYKTTKIGNVLMRIFYILSLFIRSFFKTDT